VGVHTDTFKRALRSALREDPDIVLVGEMRDLETIRHRDRDRRDRPPRVRYAAHDDAASTVDRMIDQFPADRQSQIRVMLSESLKGVIAQTLCKKLGGGRVAGAGDTAHDAGDFEPHPRRKDVPDPLDHPDLEGARMLTLNDALLDLVEKKEISPDEAYVKSVEKSGLARHSRPRGHKLTITA